MEILTNDPQYLQLIEEIEENKIALELDANRALGWLMGLSTDKRLPLEKGFAFNYIQWLILLPGVMAVFLIPIIPALILLASCAVLSMLVNRIKSTVLLSGVREFIKQDKDSLDELYREGAVKFRRVKPKNQPLIQYPQPWSEVLTIIEPAGSPGGNLEGDRE